MPPQSATTKIDEMRLSALERNSEHFAQFMTNVTGRFAEVDKWFAVRVEKDENTDDRLKRIEARLDEIKGLGKWVLATFGAILLALLANFLFKGGFTIP